MTLTRQQVREIDRRAIQKLGIPSLVLMENAGRGAAEILMREGIQGPVVICCGKGNNGGDGLVIARHLFLENHTVQVHLFGKPAELSSETSTHWNVIQKMKIPAHLHEGDPDQSLLTDHFAQADWIVDALFGTGLTGPLRPPFDRLVEWINGSPARILAVDIPSGLDCDTGDPLGPTVRAQLTATFVAAKVGFLNLASREYLGSVQVVGIGAPGSLP